MSQAGFGYADMSAELYQNLISPGMGFNGTKWVIRNLRFCWMGLDLI